jgi:lipopolysaccharide/colanic/teichoic acid biosynthesis glycosyltransferase
MLNTIKLISGFVAVVLAFIFAPQVEFVQMVEMDSVLIAKQIVVMGLCLYLFSEISGLCPRMLLRSKIDFGVNLLVASIFAVVFGAFCLYILDFKWLGRWVLLLTLVAFQSLYWILNLLLVKYRFPKVYIISESVTDLLGIPAEIKSDLARQNINISFNSTANAVVAGIVNVVKDYEVVYFIPGRHGFERVGSEVKKQVINGTFVLATEDQMIEKEFAFLTYNSIVWQDWSEVPINIRYGGYPASRLVFDKIFATCLGILVFPVVFLAMLAIKISDRGPIFYKQVRLGLYGKPFNIIKLRTMVLDSELSGPQWAKVGDTRVTLVGKWLRKTRIDELPQLLNILRGEMSLIGPRPERPEFYEMIEQTVPKFRLRLGCKPGLTGWAQVNYPYGSSVSDSKNKLLYDMYYIKNADWILDFRIIMRTFIATIKGAR